MKILAVGAHPDDIESGCFATLAKHAKNNDEVHFLVMTLGEGAGIAKIRKKEAQDSAKLIGAFINFGFLKDGMVRDDLKTISIIEKKIKELRPEVVYVHSFKDRHQDHRSLSHACVSAARSIPLEIYFYENPSTLQEYAPQLYIDVTESFELKLKAIEKHRSQKEKIYMIDKAIIGLADFRAYQAGFTGGKAESFEIARIIRKKL